MDGLGTTTTLQNLCEFFSVVTRKVSKPISVARAEKIVKGILSSSQWNIIDRSAGSFLRAIELVKTRRAHFWDALIATAMLEHGVSIIVTENEQDFRRIPGITVVNPFKRRAPTRSFSH